VGVLLTAGGTAPPHAAAPAAPSIKITSPTAGQKITDNDIKVSTQTSNYKLECSDVGLPDKAGQGHIHAMIDGMDMAVLTNFYCDQNFTISGAGLKPGKHQLIAILASDTHADVGEPNTVDIDWEPSQPKALPAPVQSAAKPTVAVTTPSNGGTVGPKFNLGIQATNFSASCDLEGKGNVVGFGHFHVFVDLDMEAMMATMSMAGMIAMPCSNSVPVDLSAWASGKHTITVMLVNNDHTELETAEPAMVTVNLQGSSGAGRAAVSALPAAGSGGNLSAGGSSSTLVLLTTLAAILFGVGGAASFLVYRLRARS